MADKWLGGKSRLWSGCRLACDHRFNGVDHVPTNNWGFVWEIGSIIVICILWALKTAVSHITASPQSYIWALQQVYSYPPSTVSRSSWFREAFCALFAYERLRTFWALRLRAVVGEWRFGLWYEFSCSALLHQVLDICIGLSLLDRLSSTHELLWLLAVALVELVVGNWKLRLL